MSHEELKSMAEQVATELQSATAPLPADLRARFISVRGELFARGIYDPVLVRFDSATVPAAPIDKLAEQLAAVAAAL